MWKRMKEDIEVVMKMDPAARGFWEIILTYPGLHAIWFYRIAHILWNRNFRLLAKVLSTFVRFLTGIEIHPAAKIGRRLFIDHGSGVVIGETCEIGNDVTLYQGVTLGGTGKEKGKRHPTIGNHVLIATGAKVLGSMKIGDHSKIGAGSVVLREVPPHSTLIGIPGRIVIRNGSRVNDELDHVNLPDPIADMIRSMQRQIDHLKKEVEILKKEGEYHDTNI